VVPHPPPRPLWLLPEPLRLREHDGQPVHGSPLVLRSHAERIEAGWFDGQLVCRDYHVAEGTDHRLRWIYRERPAHNREAAWYLHGLFA
jgi:protein ImuB